MATTGKPDYYVEILSPPGHSVHSARTPSSSAPLLFRDALAVRLDVFIDEQGCRAEEEIDADDEISWHWVVFDHTADGKQDEVPVATIRLVPATTQDHGHDVAHGAEPVTDEDGHGAEMPTEPNYGKSKSLWDGREPYAKIGRLATRKASRGKGFGKLLVQQALKWAGEHRTEVGEEGKWGGLVLAHAQKAVEGWYGSMGWVKDDGMGAWWEEGIEHVAMWKRV